LINSKSLALGPLAITIATGFVMALLIIVAPLYVKQLAILGFAPPIATASYMRFVVYKRIGLLLKLTITEAMAIACLGWLLAAALFSAPYLVVLNLCL